MKIHIQTLALGLTLAISACSGPKAPIADQTPITKNSDHTNKDSLTVTIVSNARIHTMNSLVPSPEAFAYSAGKIVAVGELSKTLSKYPNAKLIDAHNATIIPGFIDAHGHLLGLGQSILNVELRGTTGVDDIVQRLKSVASTLPKGQWLLGRGWDQNDWPVKQLPKALDLDTAFPDRPVWLERVDGHAGWANSAAMESARIDINGVWQPEGGEITRDEQGNANGVFIDNAATIIQSQVPSSSKKQQLQALNAAMKKTSSVGLTAIHDAGTKLATWRLLEDLDKQNKLNVRVYAMADGASEMLNHLCHNGVQIDPEAMLTARSIKLYSDGALGSRGAALLEDYSDAPGNKGLLIESKETLSRHATKASNCGLQVNIHAIGDRGNRITLDVLAAARSDKNPGRHRIEHSQLIAPKDFQRFKQLGLIASVQPTHATSDMYWAQDRVGNERIKGAYAWQQFIALGVPLALGSDFPVEKPEPLLGFYAAVSRQDPQGWPESGWRPEERLTRQQALHGFTLGAAYAAFQEKQLGSIEIGKYADFVILDKDIMTIPERDILKTKVLATYIAGKPVYTHH